MVVAKLNNRYFRKNNNTTEFWSFFRAAQIEAGKYADAVTTFKEDLKVLPKNGWAQHGLKLAYLKMDDRVNVRQMEAQLKDFWVSADVFIKSSRIK